MAALTRGDLAAMFLRSLCIQAAWSEKGMQTLGFAYAVDPALKRIYGGDHEAPRVEALSRQLGFFNTHPYLAAAVLGCVARLLEQGEAERAIEVKSALMGPFGGTGDSFFWGGAVPLVAVAAVALGWSGLTWAPWAMVAGYAGFSLGFRAWFFRLGYRKGVESIAEIQKLKLLLWAKRIKWTVAFFAGFAMLRALCAGGAAALGLPIWQAALGGAAVACVTAWLGRRGIDPAWILYGCAFVALAWGTL